MHDLTISDGLMTTMFFVAAFFAAMVSVRQYRIPGGIVKSIIYAGLSITLFWLVISGPMGFSLPRFLSIICLWGVELTDYAPESVQRSRRMAAKERIATKGKAA